MNIKQLIVLLVSSLMLSACDNKITSDCSSETAYKLIGQTIAEAVEKKTSNEKYINTGEFIFDKAKIRALLEQLQIAVESVRTTQEDPNSSKKFCSGILKVTIPTSMLTDADQAKELENKPKISQTARTLDIEKNINIFTKKDFAYSVQPTDDGKELYVESENTIWVEMLHDITRSALLKPILEVQKAEQARQNEQEKQEVENLKRETEITKLEAEKLKVLQAKQDADELKQQLLDKQSVIISEQNVDNSQTQEEGVSWRTIDRYQVKGGLVKDTITSLMWMRCSIGQDWDGSTCQGEAKNITWHTAMKSFKKLSYEGYTGWRMPTVKELKTLVYCSSGQPAQWNIPINATEYDGCGGEYVNPTVLKEVFPTTPITWAWTSSPNVTNNKKAWVINFGLGSSPPNGNKDGAIPVRLVRSY